MLMERLKKIGRALTGDDQAVPPPAESETTPAVVDQSPKPETKAAKRTTARTSNPGVRKLRLNFHALSEEDLSAMTSETLHDGGGDYVAPPPRDPEVGEAMPDGTVYAGVSPDTGQAMFATPSDAPEPMKWNEALKYAKDLDAHGHQDWRVPTKDELNVLFNNRAAIGGFNVTGSNPAGWYWSASEHLRWNALDQRFSDGVRYNLTKARRSSVRCVR